MKALGDYALGTYPPEPQAPPSTYAVAALIDGEPGALPRVVGLTLLRAVPIGVGLYIAGERKHVVRNATIVSTTLTAGMLAYVLWRKSNGADGAT